jgi:hypothetical protein
VIERDSTKISGEQNKTLQVVLGRMMFEMSIHGHD